MNMLRKKIKKNAFLLKKKGKRLAEYAFCTYLCSTRNPNAEVA